MQKLIKLPTSIRSIFGTMGEIEPKEGKQPLFITGCMRSGTTYLVNKITSHPQLIKIGAELNDIWTSIGGAPMLEECEFRDASHANGNYTYQMTRYFDAFINESRSFKRKLMRANQVLGSNLGRINYDWDNLIPVNKSPHLINKIEYLNALYPSAKLILIVRDIFSHSSSMKIHFDKDYASRSIHNFKSGSPKACWSRYEKNNVPADLMNELHYPSEFKLIPEMWIRLNALAFESLGKLDRKQFLVIDYADLVNHQTETLNSVFDFLDLDEKHRNHESRIVNKKVKYINTTTTGDPLEKWKRLLSTSEQTIINSCIEQNMEDYNKISSQLELLKVKA